MDKRDNMNQITWSSVLWKKTTHPRPVVILSNLLWNFNGFHLHVRVVGLEILLSEAIAVIEPEGTGQQLHCVTQLEVFGWEVLVHLICWDLQHTAGEGLWKEIRQEQLGSDEIMKIPYNNYFSLFTMCFLLKCLYLYIFIPLQLLPHTNWSQQFSLASAWAEIETAFPCLTTSHLTWFESLGHPPSAHHDREGNTTVVGFMELSDLHCVVRKVIVDANGPGFSVHWVSVIPQGVETQHLNREKLRDWN